MSHRCNIYVPVKLLFRPLKVRWGLFRAEVIDWVSDDTVVTRRSGRYRTVQVNRKQLASPEYSEFQSVSVGLHLLEPRGDLGEVLAELGSRTLRVSRDYLPPGLLEVWENPQSQLEISGRTFPILMAQAVSLSKARWRNGMLADPWKMREEFLNLDRDLSELLAFLERWGAWQHTVTTSKSADQPMSPPLILFPHIIWEQQEQFRAALVGPASRWLRAGNTLSLASITKPPYFVLNSSTCLNAIANTITIDHLANVKFGLCHREDCRKLFERTTKQARIFCSPGCAHLANVRRLRARQKTKSSRRKGATRNAKG